MSPERFSPKLIEELEGENKTARISGMVYAAGLDGRIRVESGTAKNGKTIVRLTGTREIPIDPEAVDRILAGDMPCLFRFMESCFVKERADMSAIGLLNEENFSRVVLANVDPGAVKFGNEVLTRIASADPRVIPCTYGSTSGLNFAEVLETALCSLQAGDRLGRETVVVFGTDGHESTRADGILTDSLKLVSGRSKKKYEDFAIQLGQSLDQQRINAAKLLLQNFIPEVTPPVFVEETLVTREVGENFTVGKLLLLAKLAGSDPVLFKSRSSEQKSSRLLARLDDTSELSEAVGSYKAEMAGFGYYAREAVLAADFSGAVVFPFKLTTHANIYKILGSYGSLFSPETGSGAILCPISRHRIQTAEQARLGSDPVDVTVLALVAQEFPEAFASLIKDFLESCRVLSVEEARMAGTKDRKFIVEEYFPMP